MKGYKVFNPDWTCRGFQYEVGQTYEMDGKPDCCFRGFHFCTKAADCFQFYRFDSNNKVAEVEALGDIDVTDENNKCCTNKIHIVRELTWHEVLDLVNLGANCTGFSNSGDWNSGDWNSGDWNSGDWNSGNYNSGDWNSGNRNSGNRNSGNRNSGNYNSGDWNSGNWNSGDWNSGDWNKASNCVGCFNIKDKPLFFFDKPTDMTLDEWYRSDACHLLNQVDFRPADWIWFEHMTDEEKEQHPDAETTGGYLKIRDNSDCFNEWWNGLSEDDKQIIKAIPNFDADKFFEITGIRVD